MNIKITGCISAIILLFFATAAVAQTTMGFEEYEPVSTLKTKEHKVSRAKFPFIDVHNHQWNMPNQNLKDLLVKMDSLNMQVMVNLSGRSYKETSGRNGFFDVNDFEYLTKSIDNINGTNPNRLLVFTNISFVGFGEKDWPGKTILQLEKDVKAGARGLKLYKEFGMEFKDEKDNIIHIDDSRLDAVWKKCGELNIPVLIHSADPKSFWLPVNKDNERWLELTKHPDRKRTEKDPSWDKVINEQHNMFLQHPHTKFIAAHFGWLANDLERLGNFLDSATNVYVEFGAIISDLGRQPKAAKAFFTRYQDRILFGKDSWVPAEYATYFRILETDDEYFPYHKKYHAYWKMYGMGLPDDILKKIYYKNALNVIPGLDSKQFPE
ncbi:MAG: amidohydrolase family protein [Chitinophagaceae bacterium]|nr:amidohydrolase family protein [Chitinophagaceae bacterium]